MRGNVHKNVLAENVVALSGQQSFERWANRQGLLCWKCQKTKPRAGGSEQMMDGFGGKLRKFICQDCVEAKQRSKECQDQNHQNP